MNNIYSQHDFNNFRIKSPILLKGGVDGKVTGSAVYQGRTSVDIAWDNGTNSCDSPWSNNDGSSDNLIGIEVTDGC